MITTYTPGPWIKIGIEKAGVIGIMQDDKDAKKQICTLAFSSMDTETRIANANLIKEAPELLAALEEALRILGMMEVPVGLEDEMNQCEAQIMSVIEKAKV